MRDKNLNAYQDQDDTTEQSWLQTTGDGQAKTGAKPSPEETEEKRHHPNDDKGNGQL